MRSYRRRSLGSKTVELAFACPQVIGQRVARIVMAGAQPSGRELTEIHRMGAEKFRAFFESWHAMSMQMFRANQTLTISFWRWYWQFWLFGQGRWVPPLQSLAFGILRSGITPIHRAVIANAKRLNSKAL